MDTQVILDRLVRLVRMDTTVFEEVRDDPTFTIPAIIIAAASFFIAALGGWFWWLVEGYGNSGRIILESVVLGTVFAVLLWAVWLGVAYLLLVNIYHYQVNFERLVRTGGIATIPAALGLFMFIPGINLGVGIASLAFMFLLMDIAIQVSVDAQPGHVILANCAGFLIFAAALSLLATTSDPLAPGVFLFRPLASAFSGFSKAFTSR